MQLPRKKLESPAEGVSRRTFLKGAGIAAAAVGVSGVDVAGETPSSQESLIVGPGPVPFQLTINGDTRSIEVPPSTTLLDLLRDKLGMTGSKRVCDRGSCGACTVMFDGKIVDSCSILAIDAVGREITTIEGIGTPENLSALQQAFIECDALQCGFCTPAMVVSCTALLNDNAKPTRDEIRAGISGNLCRCGTYINVFEAVEKTSGQGGRDD
ncbi:MAG TPA: (2Fe-2S)-binding protein [Planctomycetes bacterium]|nr:(2Fe-2S)-binding protein [Planctomycetota bacterium]HIN79547.1 (2Fe-2S)-binding protein [Planctomycetota bacterium]